ncbi:STAS domain-containing protein [Bounagaea algeriensis]
MTSHAPRTSASAPGVPDERSPTPAVELARELVLQLWRPTSTSVVLRVAGELDSSTAPRLHELLAPRLSSTVESVILDLSELDFMGVAGLELLNHARRRGAGRAISVCIVDGPVCVDRALRAAGWSDTVPTYPTVAAAVAELTGRARERVTPVGG